MVCVSQCGLAIIIIIAQFYKMLSCNKSQTFVNFINTLDFRQSKIYESVINERMNLYVRGQILGLVIGLGLLYIAYLNRNKQNSVIKYFNVCGLVIVVSVVSYFYYSLSPKSTYMLKHLYTREQNDRWLDIYKEMKNCSIEGFLIGIIAYFILFAGILI
jgi:hypothetical protein